MLLHGDAGYAGQDFGGEIVHRGAQAAVDYQQVVASSAMAASSDFQQRDVVAHRHFMMYADSDLPRRLHRAELESTVSPPLMIRCYVVSSSWNFQGCGPPLRVSRPDQWVARIAATLHAGQSKIDWPPPCQENDRLARMITARAAPVCSATWWPASCAGTGTARIVRAAP